MNLYVPINRSNSAQSVCQTRVSVQKKTGFRRMVNASPWPLLSKLFFWRLFLRFSATILNGRLDAVYQTSGRNIQFSGDFFIFRTKKNEKQIKPSNSEKIFKFFLIDNKFRLQVLRIQKNKLAQKMLTVRKSVRFSSFVTAQATSLLCVSDSLSIDHWALSRLISPHPKRTLLA